MKNKSKKTTIQIMYETVMERGGPQGPFSKAVVEAYEETKKFKEEKKVIISFLKKNYK